MKQKLAMSFDQVKNFVGRKRKAATAAGLALAGGSAFAGEGGISLDASNIATTAVSNLSGLLSDAAPWIAAAIGAAILLRWVRRVFGF